MKTLFQFLDLFSPRKNFRHEYTYASMSDSRMCMCCCCCC